MHSRGGVSLASCPYSAVVEWRQGVVAVAGGHIMAFLAPPPWLDRRSQKAPAGCSTEKKRYERSDQNRCADYWRGPLRTVCRFRTGPARHEGASRRHSRQDRRPVRRALSGKADLRHSGHPLRHRPGPDRSADGADQAVQSDLPSQRDGGEDREDRRPRLSRHHRCRPGLRVQGGGDLRRRRLVPAEAPAGAGHRGL